MVTFRLPQSAAVHRETYDDASLDTYIDAYDARSHDLRQD